MGASVKPETTYSPDNPFAPKPGSQPQGYSPDNPFAPTATPMRMAPVVVRPPSAPSTFDDSLHEITGKPRFEARSGPNAPDLGGVGVARGFGEPAGGYYLGGADLLRSNQSDFNLAHEHGHRMDPTSSDDVKDRSLFDGFVRYLDAHPNAKPQGYAATNRQEQFAEAFAQGVQFLRDYMGPNDRKAATPGLTSVAAFDLARKDETVPGTKAVVDYLLQQPLYANHQLRSARGAGVIPPYQPPGVKPDVTQTLATSDHLPNTSLVEKLGEDLGPELRPQPPALEQMARQVVQHPLNTAASMVVAPLQSAATLGKFAGQKARAIEGRPPVLDPVSGRDAALAAAQLGTLAIAGPAEEMIGPAAAPLIGSRAAGVVARTVPAAAIGAAYNPEHPVAGAVVGGTVGALANEFSPARPTVRRLVTREPGAMLADETTPRAVQATGRVLETPPLPEGPDFTVEQNSYSPDNPFAPKAETPNEPVTPRAGEQAAVGKSEPVGKSPENSEPPAPTLSRADRIILRGEGQPAVRADDGSIYTRKLAAEHGDLIPWAEEQGASFEKSAGPDVSGWLLDGKFVSVRDVDGEAINGVHYSQSKPAAPKEEAPQPAPTTTHSSDNPFAPPEKTDLFGNAVAPAVEQGGLFGEGVGTERQREDLKQLARKDEAISPEEMTERRDELGAAKPKEKLPAQSPEIKALLTERRRIALNITNEGGAKAARAKIATIDEQIAKLREPAKAKKPARQRVEGAVNPKYRLEDNDALLDRAAELETRLEAYSSGEHGPAEFVREQPDNVPIVGGTHVRQRLAQDSDLYHEVVAELRARGLDEEAIEEGLAKRGRTIETGDTSFAADARAFAMGSSAARPRRVGPKPPPTQQPAPAAAAAAPASNLPAGATQATGVVGAAKAAVAPAHVSQEAAQSARIIRAQAGRNALDSERAVESLKTVKKLFNKLGRQASLDAYDRAERGAHTNTPADQALGAMQKMLADKRDEIINLGTGKLSQWIANYLPHIYSDPVKAKAVIGQIVGKRPLEGTKSFLKHRAIPTLKDAMAQGLEPVSWNPVDLTLLKLREMNRYLMAQRILREHKDAGLVHFVPALEKAPQDYQRINDNIAMVYGPPNVQVNEAFDLLVRQQLTKVINSLGGLTHERKVSLGGRRLGYAMSSGDYMASKFGSQDVVIMHELGHILDFRYKLWDYLTGGARPGMTGKKAPPILKELRDLADLRYEGQQPTGSFKHYVRVKEEQIANAVHALIYAPEKLKQVAPEVDRKLRAFLKSRPELKPILGIKPSLVLGSATAEKPVGGLVVKGQYWAPADVARVLNNYLAPGLRGRNAIYDSYMYVGNMLNQAQLGLSAFHLGFTSIDAAVSQTAVGLQNLAAGRVKMAAQQLNPVSIAAAPLTTLLRGDKLLRAYLRPHGVSPELLKFVEAVTESGGRVRMDSFYKSGAINAMVENFRNAFQGTGLAKSQRVGAGVKMTVEAPAALLEALAKPVLEWVVPRQKLGVFMQLAEHELATLPKNATPDDVRKALDSAWDSTDDRLGQVVYDNLFWNRTGKDLSHALVRSVGWNFGDIRQLGGGAADWVKIANDAVHGRKPDFTPRAAYVLALPLILGVVGALMTRLRSGDDPGYKKGQWQGIGFMLKDLYFPRTGRDDPDGNPERDTPPSYMRDVAAYGRHTVQTIQHKLHPELAAVADMLENKDFYGDQIHNPDDPWWKQRAQDLKYGVDQFTPLGVRNAREQKKRNQSTTEKALGFVGVTAAPRELVRSPAQNKMADYLARRGHVSKTPEEKAQSANRSQLMDDLRSGQATRADVKAAEQRGDIKPGQGKRMIRTAKENPLVTRFKQLSAEEAQKVFELANPQEKALWAPLLRRKQRAARRVGPLR